MTNEDIAGKPFRPLSSVSDGPIRDLLLESINLLDNYTRGRVAEVVVAHLLDAQMVGDGYGDWDLEFLGSRVEVKASGEIQSWPQSRPSRITFGVERTEGWLEQPDGSFLADREKVRRSDAYVFCHHAGVVPDDPLEWAFYVASTKRIDETCDDQKTIGVASLLGRVGAITTAASDLRAVVADVLQC